MKIKFNNEEFRWNFKENFNIIRCLLNVTNKIIQIVHQDIQENIRIAGINNNLLYDELVEKVIIWDIWADHFWKTRNEELYED